MLNFSKGCQAPFTPDQGFALGTPLGITTQNHSDDLTKIAGARTMTKTFNTAAAVKN